MTAVTPTAAAESAWPTLDEWEEALRPLDEVVVPALEGLAARLRLLVNDDHADSPSPSLEDIGTVRVAADYIRLATGTALEIAEMLESYDTFAMMDQSRMEHREPATEAGGGES
jgi:hypothetical protein